MDEAPDPQRPSPDDAETPDAGEDEEHRTPFDNPFFLPVMLLGFAVWMGYDGWLNDTFIQGKLEAGETWKVAFNQWGAAICGVLGALLALRAVRDRTRGRDPAGGS